MVGGDWERRLDLFDIAHLPIGAVILYRIVVVLILGAMGVHAYLQYRRKRSRITEPERWALLGFTFVLAIASIFNLYPLFRVLKYGDKQGPFNFGVFSLLIFVLYIIFASGVKRRTRI